MNSIIAQTQSILDLPIARLPLAQRNQLAETTALVVASAIGRPLATIHLRANVGRVVLIDYAPIRYSDPVVPVPMVAGLSEAFWRAWGDYCNELPTLGGNDPQWWSQRLTPYLSEVLAHLARPTHRRLFTATEYDYLRLKLALPLAMPGHCGIAYLGDE